MAVLVAVNPIKLYLVLQMYPMKSQLLVFILLTILFVSCARGVSPAEAASGRYKKCRAVR